MLINFSAVIMDEKPANMQVFFTFIVLNMILPALRTEMIADLIIQVET